MRKHNFFFFSPLHVITEACLLRARISFKLSTIFANLTFRMQFHSSYTVDEKKHNSECANLFRMEIDSHVNEFIYYMSKTKYFIGVVFRLKCEEWGVGEGCSKKILEL